MAFRLFTHTHSHKHTHIDICMTFDLNANLIVGEVKGYVVNVRCVLPFKLTSGTHQICRKYQFFFLQIVRIFFLDTNTYISKHLRYILIKKIIQQMSFVEFCTHVVCYNSSLKYIWHSECWHHQALQWKSCTSNFHFLKFPTAMQTSFSA